jgi:hypothetical protein
MKHTNPCTLSLETCDFYTKFFPFTSFPEYDDFTEGYKLFVKSFRNEPSGLIIEVRYVS